MVYAVSQAVAEFLELEGIARHKIAVFDNSLGSYVNTDWADNMISRVINSEQIHVLFVGRLVYMKGVQYLLSAVKLLIEEGIDIHCTIVGEGYYGSELKDFSENLNLNKCVTFTGMLPRQEVDRYYSSTDIVVVPSIGAEAAGLVVPEAHRWGKPVVVSDAGGLPEWAHRLTGIYIARAADSADLAMRIREAAASPDLETSTSSGSPNKYIYRDILHDVDTFQLNGEA